jgi:hypothetical protein
MSLKLKQKQDENNDFAGDAMDGATDIVFLLIIFFLVASSFSSEKKEQIDLTERSMDDTELAEDGSDAPASPQGQEKYDLRFVLYKDGVVKMDELEVELAEPNSLELYYRAGIEIDRKFEEILIEDPNRPMEGDPPRPRMVVQLWADKESQSGMAMQILMACLDKELKPDVLFLQELERFPEFSDIRPDPPAFDPATRAAESLDAPE